MRNSDSRYKSALRYILSREIFGVKLGLENISRFLDYLGNPEKKFPSVHIAGTNGKGSTAAYLDSILRQAGYKTGIFTSPHLVDFTERIRVNASQVSEQYVTNFIEEHKKTISRYKITFFELCTALAFSYFADKKVDIAIIETGLGEDLMPPIRLPLFSQSLPTFLMTTPIFLARPFARSLLKRPVSLRRVCRS